MGVAINRHVFDARRAVTEVQEFRSLLATGAELKEAQDILPFFGDRPHLSAMVATLAYRVNAFDLLSHEFDVFQDFRADLVVGDDQSRYFCLVEFENARRDSIFGKRLAGSRRWAPRFDQGNSQLIDWLCKMDDMRTSNEFRKRFRGEVKGATALLVIGRRAFMDEDEQHRFDWRREKVVVDSNRAQCITYDDLCDDMEARLRLYSLAAFASGNSGNGDA